MTISWTPFNPLGWTSIFGLPFNACRCVTKKKKQQKNHKRCSQGMSFLILYFSALQQNYAFRALTTGVQGWVLPLLIWTHLPSDFHASYFFRVFLGQV